MSLRTSGKTALLSSAFVTFLAGLAAVTGVRCKPSADQGSVEILTVDDPFTGPPAATEITVDAIAYADGGAYGAVTTLARAPATAGTLDLGTYDEQTAEALFITATDSSGSTVASGESLAFQLGALSGVTLGVFVQRTGMLSRMPTPLSDGRPAPIVSMLAGRYIFVAGGSDTSLAEETNLYDLVSWAPLASPPVLPVAPASVAFAELEALAVTSTGGVWYDLTESDTSDGGATNGSPDQWAAVAGGQTIVSTDYGTSFVVGGTRPCAGAASQSNVVLLVRSSQALLWGTFTAARCGATATYIEGTGLVIEGGNAATGTTGGSVAGAESMSDDGVPYPYDYPADFSSGAGMVPLGPDGTTTSSNVLVVGGVTSGANGGVQGGTQARVITIPCGTTAGWAPCSTTPWPATIPTALTFTQAFAIDSQTAFVVGDDTTGVTHAYRLTSASVAEVPFRVTRSHARAVSLPLNNAIAVVGGDPNIESFIP